MMESDKSLDVAVEIKVPLDHGSHQALYQQIADRIWHDVVEGTLAPGQRLPTVRQLAVNLGVHLDTVSRAYQQLERLGVVRRQPGAGTVVGLNASRQSELEQQKRLDEICRTALQDAELIGASIDDVMGLLSEIRRGDSPARKSTLRCSCFPSGEENRRPPARPTTPGIRCRRSRPA
jgi:GntR family transcriptional regulator